MKKHLGEYELREEAEEKKKLSDVVAKDGAKRFHCNMKKANIKV